MDNVNKVDAEIDQSKKDIDEPRNQNPSEFVIGLVTFIVFIIFMTVWMYFGLTGVIDY